MKLNLEDRKMIIGEILHLKDMFDPEGEDAAAMDECVMRLAVNGGLVKAPWKETKARRSAKKGGQS